MLDVMTVDDLIAKRIKEALREKDWSESQLAEKSGIKQGTLNKFLRRDTKHMNWERISQLEKVLGLKLIPDSTGTSDAVPVSVGQQVPAGVHSIVPSKLVPVVDLRRLPRGLKGEEFFEKLRAEAHDWFPAPAQGRFVFYLQAPEAVRLLKGDVAKGDIFLGDPDLTPVAGNAIIVPEASGHSFADTEPDEQDPGKLVARLPDGRRIRNPDPTCTIRGRFQPWI